MDFYEELQFAHNNDNNAESPPVTAEVPTSTHTEEVDDGAESDYSLDYEYLGPRRPNYRNEQDADSDASELSCTSYHESEEEREQDAANDFDMWDEDPYSTNDFTWESNDMRLTRFIKKRKKKLDHINSIAQWPSSFWRKEKGWPRQLPASSSTTNHDQSANALSLVLSDFGISEKLHAVYRDRIIECGKQDYINSSRNPSVGSNQKPVTHESNSVDDKNATNIKTNETTYLDNYTVVGSNDSPMLSTDSISKYNQTHASISLPKPTDTHVQQQNVNNQYDADNTSLLSKFIPYTKYIKRSQFPIIFPQDAYLSLGFEPLCLAEKYGYMAIGGVEGEFELYCCMGQQKPIKIWGNKFKGKDNVLLMTNAVQIVRWKNNNDLNVEEYNYYLVACMNEAGVLLYNLPKHHQCHTSATTSSHCQFHSHLKCFDQVPINDARVSPNGQHLICVGDDACIFHISITIHEQRLVFGSPQKFKIPLNVLLSPTDSITFSSQYLAWSKSSYYFAHTSDSHNTVLVWRTEPKLELLYRIDAGGYTYAIQFHPEHEGVLAFTNRYGYLHTVNLEETFAANNPHKLFSLKSYDQYTHPKQENQEESAPIYHTLNIHARHEITMISFRGEKNRRLRILAKINGLQWSHNGCYLYVSTKKRVLAYEFMQSSSHVKSLEKLAGLKALSVLEENLVDKKRKSSFDDQDSVKKKRRYWQKKWKSIPPHVRQNVLGQEVHHASHW